MPALKQLFVLALLCALLSGCGSRPPRLEPPNIKLVDLTLQPDSREFSLRVRLSNPVPRVMTVQSVTFSLRIDDLLLGDFTSSFTGLLPGLGEEVLTVQGQATAALMDRLQRLNGGAMAPLAMTGEVTTDDGQSFDLASKGWLSPTPGRPWSFR